MNKRGFGNFEFRGVGWMVLAFGLILFAGCRSNYDLWQVDATKLIWNSMHLKNLVAQMWLLGASTIAIILFSGIITAIQSIPSENSPRTQLYRTITIIISTLIFIVTGVKSAFFRVSYWELSYAVEDVEDILNNFDLRWSQHDSQDPQIASRLTVDILETREKIRTVQYRLRKESTKPQSTINPGK